MAIEMEGVAQSVNCLSLQGSSCLAAYDPSKGPYLIGLTGGITSGKSSIFGRLVKMGAYPIDCDKVHVELAPSLLFIGFSILVSVHCTCMNAM